MKVIYVGRHGERTPLYIPAGLKKDWGVDGVLTSKGEETQYKKGQYLGEKYKDFLSAARVVCQTSYLDRTIDSGYCLLSGLLGLPFTSPEVVSKKDKISFLAKHGAKPRPWNVDVLYGGYLADLSPNSDVIKKELLESAREKKEHFDKLIPIMPVAAKVLEKKLSDPLDYFEIFDLYDLLECYRANGKAFPEGLEGEKLYKELVFVHAYLLHNLMFKSEALRRVTNHYIFKEFISIIMDKSEPTFHYYSSHDLHIYVIILGLGYDIKEAPPHTTGLTIEVYKSSEGSFVKLDYKGECFNKKIFPSLEGEYIPLEHLLDKLRTECYKDDEEYKKHSGNKDFDYIRDYVNAEPILT